jgi:hypothetical protein
MSSRQEIAERVIARWKTRGFDLESDREFVEILGKWIEGTIDMIEMRRRYIDLIRTRADARIGRSGSK